MSPSALLALEIAAVAASLLTALVASAHAVMYKRDPRSAIAWCVLIWVTPLVGALLYVALGVNRIQRRAVSMRRRRGRLAARAPAARCDAEQAARGLGRDGEHLAALARLGDSVVGRPLAPGNSLAPLVDGEQAYPAMLDAIASAERSVGLLAYILGDDEVGRRFVLALAAAARRGVEVRVLVDHVGGGPGLGRRLAPVEDAGGRAALFHPLRLGLRTRFSHLRNHRKLLLVDGRVAFTGGMNLRDSHLVSSGAPDAERDVHFRVEGPVVEQLAEAFADDWAYTTREVLRTAAWFPALSAAGDAPARVVAYDPGMPIATTRLVLAGAVASARRSVRLVTPYFLPDASLVSALGVAALRGVEVDVVVPERTDWAPVTWATTSLLWQVLQSGCRVWRTPPPFDHAKLVVVDGLWTFLGSANWDERSLRLNFELNVECYDAELAARVGELVRERMRRARPVTLAEVDRRPGWQRLRDGVARLGWPYL